MATATNEAGATEAIPNLRQRMLAAMTDIGRVAKDGFNSGQQYNYTKADDIISECRGALIKHGIVFLSSEVDQQRLPDREAKSGAAILGVVVKMQFTLMDTTSDEKLVAGHSGEGMDSGDKAVNKAKTAALKYFLQQTFLIPTGDDPEKDDHEVKKVANAGGKQAKNISNGTGESAILASEAQRKFLLKSAKSAMGDKEGKAWVAQRMADLGITGAENFQAHHFQMMLNELNQLRAGEDNQEPAEDSDIPF